MTDEEFEKIIQRYNDGLASPEEIYWLESWLKHRSQEGLFQNISPSEKERIKRNLYHEMVGKIESSQSSTIDLERRRKRRPLFYMVRAASVLIILSLFGLIAKYVWQIYHPEVVTLEVQSSSDSGSKKVLLADGSIVWLKGESRLTYPSQFSDTMRMVTLEGEALFEISKQTMDGSEMGIRKPFVVLSAGIETRVLGTSFNIRSRENETEVFVLTGKVAVSDTLGKQRIELLPKEKGLFQRKENLLQKMELMPSNEGVVSTQLEEYVAGTEYDMHFDNVKMVEAAQRIGQKFNIKVVLSSNMEACMIRADFTDQSLDKTMDMVAEALNAIIHHSGEVYTINGPGCN
ncbi:FecR family protein [Membranihabitans marinus]|uniref:FecR family protein n=1 Tax=Membranihabitans marinus TaxID=1227546 RepID=UPI001F2A4A68|nr:FecR family protein [Membranihabitans marinus]